MKATDSREIPLLLMVQVAIRGVSMASSESEWGLKESTSDEAEGVK